MAQSNVGGAFGFLRKSIGSIVYSTSTASLSGEKKQVARSKPTSVRNPRTISQIVQRMKVGPAQLFYAAFEKAAGSVENNPLSHSWQGVPYGPKSRTKFLQLAMTGEPKAYVPKGINFPVPGVYQVSEGSLPSLPSGNHTTSENVIFTVGEDLSQANVTALLAQGVQAGDQVTMMALIDNNGVYEAGVARVIVGVGNSWELLNINADITGTVMFDDGASVDGATASVACFAFILSRGTSSASAKRSTAFMTVAPDYANLMSPEAYNAAIDSYLTGTLYNSLNSDWYLNQGSTQAFNGEIFTLAVPTANDDTQTCDIMLGRRLNGGQLEYVVFYYQINQGNKDPYEVANGSVTITINTTLAKVIETLGNVSYVEQGITPEQALTYYRQMSLQGGKRVNPQPEPSQRTPLEILTAYVNQLWESHYHYGYDIDNLLVIGMPEQKFAFGFEANDASAYAITRYYSENESEYMELQGSYNQDETFTLQRYKSRTQFTEDDFEYLDGSGGFTFPVSESEWQTLIGLVNNAVGVNLPIVILHN